MKSIRSSCGIIWRGNRILLAKRLPEKYYGNYWEFPGGKIEPGETPESCLYRELEEEIGILVTDIAPWRRVFHRYPDREVTLYFFFCKPARRHEARSLECAALKWAHRSDLIRYPFPPANDDVARDLAGVFTCFPLASEMQKKDLHV